MKWPVRSSLLLTLALATGPVHAQRPKEREAKPGPWANKLFMPNVERNPNNPAPRVLAYDFGTVPFGTVCTKTFTVTNPYAVPMQVLDVRVECGCLKAHPPNKVLHANESADFTVTMDAGKFKGANAKRMYVTFGPDNVSVAELEFKATSREDVSISPGGVDFGFVPRGTKTPARVVTVKYTGRRKDWTITDVVRPSAALDVECKEVSRHGPFGVTYQVAVTLKDDAPAGPLTEPVQLKTNDPTTPFLTLNVTARVQPPLAVIPDTVTFRGSTVGTERQYKVLVRGSGGTEFSLTADTPPDESSARAEGILPTARNVHVLTVKYTPRAAGPFRHEVKLRTSLGGPPLVVVVEGDAK